MHNCHFIVRKLLKYFVLSNIVFVGILFVLNSKNTQHVSKNHYEYYQSENYYNFTFTTPSFRSSKARFDNFRMIKIYDWIRTANMWDGLNRNFNVCLATQGSVDRIWSIVEVAEKWQGPVSLAVYISTSAEWAILNGFISYLEKCSDIFRDTVSVHMAVPVNFTMFKSKNETEIMDRSLNSLSLHSCEDPRAVMNSFINTLMPKGRDSRILYPQNHMRNLARKTCGTDWVFMTDVDIIPKQNSALALQEFYNSPQATSCVKCAFVVPTFELDNSVPFPDTKEKMIHYVNNGYARPFHIKIYHFGHESTNYDRWYNSNIRDGPIRITHVVNPNKMKYYEPFYISSDKIPPHDERFLGYGFTRNSQVLEAKMSGWNFTVLSPIFAAHWGLQTPRTIYSPIYRGKNLRVSQIKFNSRIYKDLDAELKAKKLIERSKQSRNRASASGTSSSIMDNKWTTHG